MPIAAVLTPILALVGGALLSYAVYQARGAMVDACRRHPSRRRGHRARDRR